MTQKHRTIALFLAAVPAIGLSLAKPSHADSTSDKSVRVAALRAFHAWEVTGEQNGNYKPFLSLRSDSNQFEVFSHPAFPHAYNGKAAWQVFHKLISERTKKPNQNIASHIAVFVNGRNVAFQYDVTGHLNGSSEPDHGFNIIVLTMASEKVVGFQEYTGTINPAWFQKPGQNRVMNSVHPIAYLSPAGANTTQTTQEATMSTNPSVRQAAEKAFAAWQKGEGSGDYTDFIALMGEDEAFQTFSNPADPHGVMQGKAAAQSLRTLTETRTKAPNHLTFSHVVAFENGNQVAFQFNSDGTLNGVPGSYHGFNIVVLTMAGDKVVGFREYYGFIDPAWFKQ